MLQCLKEPTLPFSWTEQNTRWQAGPLASSEVKAIPIHVRAREAMPFPPTSRSRHRGKLLVFRHRSPCSFWRLREPHLVALVKVRRALLL